jgi:hypothetical protein
MVGGRQGALDAAAHVLKPGGVLVVVAVAAGLAAAAVVVQLDAGQVVAVGVVLLRNIYGNDAGALKVVCGVRHELHKLALLLGGRANRAQWLEAVLALVAVGAGGGGAQKCLGGNRAKPFSKCQSAASSLTTWGALSAGVASRDVMQLRRGWSHEVGVVNEGECQRRQHCLVTAGDLASSKFAVACITCM